MEHHEDDLWGTLELIHDHDTWIIAALRELPCSCDNPKCYACSECTETFFGDRIVYSQPFQQDGGHAEDDCFAVEWEEKVRVNAKILAEAGPVAMYVLRSTKPILRTSIPSDSDIVKASIQGDKSIGQKIPVFRLLKDDAFAVLNILKFVATGKIPQAEPLELVELLSKACKFGAPDFFKHCLKLLGMIGMNYGIALQVLAEGNAHLRIHDSDLANEARKFISAKFKNMDWIRGEGLSLPDNVLRIMLKFDDLSVLSEDVLYDFVMQWAVTNISEAKERRKWLNNYVVEHIRFPFLTFSKLKNIWESNDFEPQVVQEYIWEALKWREKKGDCLRSIRAEENLRKVHHRFVPRAYQHIPVKKIQFELPNFCEMMLYFNLSRNECRSLFVNHEKHTESFDCGGSILYLTAHCRQGTDGLFHFGVSLSMHEDDFSGAHRVEYQFGCRVKPLQEYEMFCSSECTLLGGRTIGLLDLFRANWDVFMGEDSRFFIHDILHLQVKLKMYAD